MNIVVLAGGLSPERNVSLSSGSLISAALRRKGHKVLMLDVYVGMTSLPDPPLSLFTIENEDARCVGAAAPSVSDLNKLRHSNGNRNELIGPNVIELCKLADAVFLALHGDMGENGQLQATLDVFGIAYTGSGYIGSLLAMNKDIAKKLMRQGGVLTPDWIKVNARDKNYNIEAIASTVGFPCIVKPCSCGSSVGVSMVENESQLSEALNAAADYEADVLVEKRIFGRELTQAYVEGVALPPVEIIPKCGFYDYANKYVANATEEICPAPIGSENTERLNNITARCFEALCLSDYARIDYILDENGAFWCLEANTLPGMTPTSLMPQEAKAVGIDYDSLCEKLVMMSIKKKK